MDDQTQTFGPNPGLSGADSQSVLSPRPLSRELNSNPEFQNSHSPDFHSTAVT
ncbi:hypothetical protein BGX24_008669, partial [Mortierella sp. AD032]